MAAFSPDFAASMSTCVTKLKSLEHTVKLSERFARVLAQFADGAEATCRRTGNAPVECSNELFCFIYSASVSTRGRARALEDFVERSEQALKH